jgi:hypothetical protein
VQVQVQLPQAPEIRRRAFHQLTAQQQGIGRQQCIFFVVFNIFCGSSKISISSISSSSSSSSSSRGQLMLPSGGGGLGGGLLLLKLMRFVYCPF